VISGNDISMEGTAVSGAVSINYTGSSNLNMMGNLIKATSTGFFLNNTSDTSCLFAENLLHGSAKSTGCNQNNNF
jgi:hypothetical protein